MTDENRWDERAHHSVSSGCLRTAVTIAAQTALCSLRIAIALLIGFILNLGGSPLGAGVSDRSVPELPTMTAIPAVLRAASQGEALYLDGGRFLASSGPRSKAQHSREARIGFQRSSPQNNFRRIVACPIPQGQFCFDTVSYVPHSECRIPPLFLLALLNSKLLDWYFRLGSTNSKVNEYQFNNLPCPVFSVNTELRHHAEIMRSVHDGLLAVAFHALAPELESAPFSRGVADAIAIATARIVEIETARGDVSKRNRAALGEESQPFQDFIDNVLFTMAGVDERGVAALDKRLAVMM